MRLQATTVPVNGALSHTFGLKAQPRVVTLGRDQFKPTQPNTQQFGFKPQRLVAILPLLMALLGMGTACDPGSLTGNPSTTVPPAASALPDGVPQYLFDARKPIRHIRLDYPVEQRCPEAYQQVLDSYAANFDNELDRAYLLTDAIAYVISECPDHGEQMLRDAVSTQIQNPEFAATINGIITQYVAFKATGINVEDSETEPPPEYNSYVLDRNQFYAKLDDLRAA